MSTYLPLLPILFETRVLEQGLHVHHRGGLSLGHLPQSHLTCWAPCRASQALTWWMGQTPTSILQDLP